MKYILRLGDPFFIWHVDTLVVNILGQPNANATANVNILIPR